MTIIIETNKNSQLSGFDEVFWNTSSIRHNFNGSYDQLAGAIILEEQGKELIAGRFQGKVSNDRTSISGTWNRSKGSGTIGVNDDIDKYRGFGAVYTWNVDYVSNESRTNDSVLDQK